MLLALIFSREDIGVYTKRATSITLSFSEKNDGILPTAFEPQKQAGGIFYKENLFEPKTVDKENLFARFQPPAKAGCSRYKIKGCATIKARKLHS